MRIAPQSLHRSGRRPNLGGKLFTKPDLGPVRGHVSSADARQSHDGTDRVLGQSSLSASLYGILPAFRGILQRIWAIPTSKPRSRPFTMPVTSGFAGIHALHIRLILSNRQIKTLDRTGDPKQKCPACGCRRGVLNPMCCQDEGRVI